MKNTNALDHTIKCYIIHHFAELFKSDSYQQAVFMAIDWFEHGSKSQVHQLGYQVAMEGWLKAGGFNFPNDNDQIIEACVKLKLIDDKSTEHQQCEALLVWWSLLASKIIEVFNDDRVPLQ